MSNLVEFLLARVAEDEAVARAATQGRWFWEPEGSSGQGDRSLIATDGTWRLCGYYCEWADADVTSRGPKRTPGHEHLNSGSVVSAWGHDWWGINVDEADADHIAAWQPARVLAECSAKRRIVDEFGSSCSDYGPPDSERRTEGEEIARQLGAEYQPHWPEAYAPFCDGCAAAQSADYGHERVLRLLALPYASHPEYRDEWAS